MAASGFSDDPYEYSAHPFVVSGSCKRESAEDHARLLDTILNVCKKQKDNIRAMIFCISSDGDSKRRKAIFKKALLNPYRQTTLYIPSSRSSRYLTYIVAKML